MKIQGFKGALREDKAGAQEIWRDPQHTNSPGDDRDLGAGQVRQRGGGRTVTGNGDRRRHAARGAKTSGGGRWVTGAGNI